MPYAVQYHQFGDLDVLRVEEVATPVATADELVVRVHAAGVNPGEGFIRSGALAEQFPSTFPSGQGTELAGIVTAVGPDVRGYSVGDAVIGYSDTRNAQAELAVVPVSNVLPKPPEVSWDVAATIPIAGATATAMVRAVAVRQGDTVVVAGGAGGVGFWAVQLAVRAGARVIATAAENDATALREVGAEPVTYGDGVADRIRAAAPDGVDAFLDTYGTGQIDLALSLGVAAERIDSIIDFSERDGVHHDGMYELSDVHEVIVQCTDLVATGAVSSPVRARIPLDRVQDAYRALTDQPGIGKVVLVMPDPSTAE